MLGFEEIDQDLFNKMIASKVYPFKITFGNGEISFCYMKDKEGLFIGTSEPPTQEDWIKAGNKIEP